MTDPNNYRAHYRANSHRLARKKARARLTRWLLAYALALLALLAILA